MSLRLLIDADVQSKQLLRNLRGHGHHAVAVNDVGLRTGGDPEIFRYAVDNDLIVVTRNAQDFEALHSDNSSHPGIFVIRADDDPRKDMSLTDIVRSINNVEASGWDFRGELVVLNAWRF